jgi:DNA-binding NtrC family response regulator
VATLLVIEDEQVLAKNIARFFERQGHTVSVSHNGLDGVQTATAIRPDLVIVDFQLPGMDGLEVIRALRKLPDPPGIVMVTGHASVTLAVDAMKAGSMDLLTKPVTLVHLQEVVHRALQERGDKKALDFYRKREVTNDSLDALVGQSAVMQNLRDTVRSVAALEPSDGSPAAPVLVLGETGTGKELVARACHQSSPRAKGPFVEINCAALPAHLIEGELFGYEKGAFTDAHARKVGLIESADGGTLFLDEIGELDLTLQAKLLRVLEDLRVRRLGSLTDKVVNVRVVAATNRNLEEQVQAGKFRADLMYRLKVLQINIAPLRERLGDVALLARHFLEQLENRYARAHLSLDASAISALQAHNWPGNVRELRNVLERAALLQRTGHITAGDLLLPKSLAHGALVVENPAKTSLVAVEREHLLRALQASHWNVTQAARSLEISRDTLRYRMERHGLQK